MDARLWDDHRTLVLGRLDVRELLSLADCIDAVEHAFLQHAHGASIAPGVLGAHVEYGGFHVKTAGTRDPTRNVFVAKINANFPGNPERHGLPTIQGVVALFDATDGRVLALLDSSEITSLRTAAATAVAARYLALPNAEVVTVCGCGAQARNQLRALAVARPLRRVMAFDANTERAEDFARAMTEELAIDVTPVPALGDSTRASDIWVTCTPTHRWFLGHTHVRPGAFIAAVGADHPEKQEIEPQLMAEGAVVTDILEQCATMGDLHHAIDAGVMGRGDVRADLADIVSGKKQGRLTQDEIIVFDSTGTALQDVAAAALVYERAVTANTGLFVTLGGSTAGGHMIDARAAS